MTIGERIRERRIELGLTQLELAHKMGYKNKSAICNVEKRGDNITSDRIEKLATVLECTPAFLMGWEIPEHSVEYSSTFEDYPEKEKLSHDILSKFRTDVQHLVIEDLKIARTLVEKRIDLHYEDVELKQDEIENDIAASDRDIRIIE